MKEKLTPFEGKKYNEHGSWTKAYYEWRARNHVCNSPRAAQLAAKYGGPSRPTDNIRKRLCGKAARTLFDYYLNTPKND